MLICRGAGFDQTLNGRTHACPSRVVTDGAWVLWVLWMSWDVVGVVGRTSAWSDDARGSGACKAQQPCPLASYYSSGSNSMLEHTLSLTFIDRLLVVG